MATVKYYGILLKQTGCSEESVEAKNIKELLKQLKTKYGKEFYTYAKKSYILINETPASNIDGYSSKLKTDDVVQFLPVCGGG